MNQDNKKQNIVLLGLGHTNAHIVKMWGEEPIENTRLICISKFPSATYSGMFPGTLAGQYADHEFRIDLQRLADRAGAELILAEVTGLDLEHGEIQFSDRAPIAFDLLSIGVGSMPVDWERHAHSSAVVPIKPMQTFQSRLNARLESVFQRKAVCQPAADSADRRSTPQGNADPSAGVSQTARIQIAIVGGGASSVEIALCLDHRLQTEKTVFSYTIKIYTRGKQVCQDMNPRSIRRVERILQRRGIEVISERTIERVDADLLFTDCGHRFHADCIIWSTGAAAPPILDCFAIEKDDRGFVAIGPTLQSVSDDRIFAVGDSGTLTSDPFPKAGVYAVRQCPVIWHNLQAIFDGRKLEEFQPQRDFLKLLNTGDGKALLEYGFLTIHARWCWHLKTWIDKKFIQEYQGKSVQDQSDPNTNSNRTVNGHPHTTLHQDRIAG